MNQFDAYIKPAFGGYHAMMRFGEDGQAEPVLEEGGRPAVYPNEIAALNAIKTHLLAYLNGHLRRDGEKATNARADAERVFCKGRMIPVEKRP